RCPHRRITRLPRNTTSRRSAPAMAVEPLRVASLGMGWWSDVLADAINRSGKLKITACYSRSEEKRAAFAAKYGCRAVPSYEAILDDKDIEAVINTTPNGVHLETTRAAADAGKHVFLDKPIANTVSDGRRITEICRKAGVVLALAINAAGKASSAGSSARSTKDYSASWSTPKPTSAAIVSARL